MRTNHRFLYGFTGYLLATLLLVGTLLSVPLFGATAAELDYEVTKVGFEAAAYSEDGDYMHTTTEERRTGDRAAKLVQQKGVKVTNPTNDITLYDDAGNELQYEAGYTYIISMYVKAADTTKGKGRFDATKNADTSSTGSRTFVGWANTSQKANSQLNDWTFLHLAFNANFASGDIIGIFANGDGMSEPEQLVYYIDDVTVVKFKADSVGVAMLDYGDGSDRAFVFGEPGAAIDFPAASEDGASYTWFKDANLAESAEGAQFELVGSVTSLLTWNTTYYAKSDRIRLQISTGGITDTDSYYTGVKTEADYCYYVGFYAKFENPDANDYRVDLNRDKSSWFGYTTAASKQPAEDGWCYMEIVADKPDTSDPRVVGQELILYFGNKDNSAHVGETVSLKNLKILKFKNDTESVLVTVPNNGEERGYAVGAAGSAASLDDPTAPDGHAFDGWCSDAGLTAKVDAPAFPAANKAATFYARYKEAAPTEDYTVTTIDFESDAYDGETYKVTTDEADAVHGGGKAAKIVGKDIKEAVKNPEGNIDLLDETGALLHYQEGDAYLIGFYVKAEAGYKGNIRIDACKVSNSNYHNYLVYGSTVPATGDWQYYVIYWQASVNEGIALFANGDEKYYSAQGVTLYVDDVTIVRMSAGFTPVLLESNNGANRTVSVGRSGEPVALDAPETIPAGKTFAGWYKNEGLTDPADGTVYPAQPPSATQPNSYTTLYAKYDDEAAIEGKTVIDYEEGDSFNWDADAVGKVTKTNNVSVSSEQKHGGSYALRVNGSYANEQPHEKFLLTRSLSSGGYADKFGSATEDRSYFVSFWYYVDAEDTVDGFAEFHPTYTNSTTMDSHHNDKLSDETNRLVISTANKGSWQRYTYTVTIPKKEQYANAWDGALMLEFTTGSPVTGTVKFFIDDVEITRIDDLLSAEAIGLSRKGYQLLNDAAFTAAGEKQAVRFVYNLDEVKAAVEGRGMHFTVKEMGILTALKIQLPGANAANLTRETAAANANVFDTVISNKRNDGDGHTRLFTAYIKNISKDFLQFNVCSRAYVLLTDEASGAEVLVYTEVLDNNVAGLLQAAKNHGMTGYDQSFAWAEIQ